MIILGFFLELKTFKQNVGDINTIYWSTTGMFLHSSVIVPLRKTALAKHFVIDLLIKPLMQRAKCKFLIAMSEILFRFKHFPTAKVADYLKRVLLFSVGSIILRCHPLFNSRCFWNKANSTNIAPCWLESSSETRFQALNVVYCVYCDDILL